MKNIAFFSIPAHGHTNPMIPVAKELVKRGNNVRFYSFNEFREKISASGAEFISCDRFLPELSKKQAENMKNVSTTEMTIQDINVTIAMDGFLEAEVKSFQPDVIYTDSVCFWGKLTALKYQIPVVVSTSTFAFNQFSSQYMQHSMKEMCDMVFGLPKINKELNNLKKYGYDVKNLFQLIQSDNSTDSVVYTSESFQPCVKSFSKHYLFMGASIVTDIQPDKKKQRPLIYISMGTVINDCPEFYKKCIDVLKNEDVDVIISCGKTVNINTLGILPDNIRIYSYVNQIEVLSKTDVFITHCGMNSVSESLYMAAPMVLYPQTSEQKAVARRVYEKGAGVFLKNDSADGILTAVREILHNKKYYDSAIKCCNDLHSCVGTSGAAEFIENAPHNVSSDNEYVSIINKKNLQYHIFFWSIALILVILLVAFKAYKYIWIVTTVAGVANSPVIGGLRNRYIKKLFKNE